MSGNCRSLGGFEEGRCRGECCDCGVGQMRRLRWEACDVNSGKVFGEKTFEMFQGNISP